MSSFNVSGMSASWISLGVISARTTCMHLWRRGYTAEHTNAVRRKITWSNHNLQQSSCWKLTLVYPPHVNLSNFLICQKLHKKQTCPYYKKRLALSRAHTFTKASDLTKLLPLKKHEVEHIQCHRIWLGPIYKPSVTDWLVDWCLTAF